MRGAVQRFFGSGLVAALLVVTVPVLFLWAHNADDRIRPMDVLLVLVWCWVGAACLYGVLRSVLHDPHRAGLAASVLIVLFCAFGHLAGSRGHHPGSPRATLLLLGFGVLAGALVVMIARARSSPASIVKGVATIAVVLIALDAWTILTAGPVVGASNDLATSATADAGSLEPSGPARDVYYLIFDRYASRSVLSELYGFDNRPFLSSLKERGMVVLDDAVANYPGTTHSLASSLNMTYLDDLASDVGAASDDWGPLQDAFRGSAIQRTFDSMGYRTVHVGSWWEPTFADPSADTNHVFTGLREFPQAFLFTTAAPWLADALHLVDIRDPARTQFERVAFQLEAIGETSMDPEPTFTFAHLTLPHTPYVFDADGRYRPSGRDMPVEVAYLDQLRATNTMIGDLLDELLGGPDASDPIIVLQSDEGPHPPALDAEPELRVEWPNAPGAELERKLRILDALYLPGVPASDVDRAMTPVNTFRVILNEYFGGDLPVLEDRVYVYSSWERPYDFVDVTQRLRPGSE